MYWNIAGLATVSPLEKLLDEGSYSLEDVLDEDDVIQEAKSLNKRLVDFLQDAEQVRKMVQYVITLSKYSYVSCAILTCEIEAIMKTLIENEQILGLLFSFLDSDHEHDLLLAGYFSKVVVCLLQRTSEPVISYIQNHQDILQKLVELIGVTSITEVLIRLLDADDNRCTWNFQGTAPVQWLAETDLLKLLVAKLGPENTSEINANAAAVLCSVTRLYQPRLVSELSKYVTDLINLASENAHCKSSIVHSLSVCISLLNPKRVGTGGVTERATLELLMSDMNALDCMLPKLGEILRILDTSNDEASLPTTYGELKPPFGTHRLKVVEFISVLLRAGVDRVGEVLVELNVIHILLKLFFEYPFNNLLHHHVEAIISTILESGNSKLNDYLFKDCDVIARLIAADENPYASVTVSQSIRENKCPPRVGNIGHLTRIAIKLTQSANQQIQEYLQDSRWTQWRSTVLEERNAVENVYQWACGRPTPAPDRSLDVDEDDNRDRDYDVSTFPSNVSQEVIRYAMFDNIEVEEDFDDDSAEMVISSLHFTDDEEGRGYFGPRTTWLSFDEDSAKNPLSPGSSPPRVLGRFRVTNTSSSSSSSSSSSDEVGVEGDDELHDTAESKPLEAAEGRPQGTQKRKIHDVTSDLEAMELTDRKAHSDGESSQFDGGTGTGTAAEGLVHQPVKTTAVLSSTEEEQLDAETSDANYWRTEYERPMIAELA